MEVGQIGTYGANVANRAVMVDKLVQGLAQTHRPPMEEEVAKA